MADGDDNADGAITKLQQLLAEFEAHKKRLKERSVEIGQKITAGTLDEATLREVVLEQFLELHDTALSLQADLAQIILHEYEAAFTETPDAGAGDEDFEEDSLLLHADAAQLRRTTTDYRAMLEAYLAQGNNEESARRSIEEKIKQAEQSLTLIDELEEDGEEDDEEAEEGEGDDDEEADEATPQN